MQLWLDLLQIQSKKSLKQRLYFPHKKDCNYGLEAKKSLKQRLVFLEKNGFQPSSDFLQIQLKNSLEKRWDFSDKKGLQPW